MKTLFITCYPNGKTTIQTTFLHFNAENKAATLTIDYSLVTDVVGWIKACDVVSADGTGNILEGTTDATLVASLTEAMLKTGALMLQPYAFRVVGEVTERVAFRACVVTVEDFSNLEGGDQVILPSIAEKLQSDIDALELDMADKMNLVGDNSDVDILQFNTTPSVTDLQEGQVRWNPTDRTLDIGMDGDGVVQQVGMETFYPKCRNNDTVQINDGQLVQYDGAIGNSGVILVKRALSTLMLPGLAMGVATENIAVNAEGRITWFGLVRGIQTNGANYGETWIDGDIIYNSGMVTGGLSKVKPVAPKASLIVGIVVNAHASNGIFFVRPTFFPFLSHLGDVSIVNPVNNDIMIYNASSGRWENANQNANFKITPEGGYAIKLINRTGAVSVKGYAVTASSAYDNACSNIVVNVPNPIGVVYESGVADGSPMWVVVSGIAEAYFANTPTRGYLARGFLTGDAGYVSGQILSEAIPTSPFATDKHFYELGHILETKGAPGLAKMVLHFN